jgi:hypothetical protein
VTSMVPALGVGTAAAIPPGRGRWRRLSRAPARLTGLSSTREEIMLVKSREELTIRTTSGRDCAVSAAMARSQFDLTC